MIKQGITKKDNLLKGNETMQWNTKIRIFKTFLLLSLFYYGLYSDSVTWKPVNVFDNRLVKSKSDLYLYPNSSYNTKRIIMCVLHKESVQYYTTRKAK